MRIKILKPTVVNGKNRKIDEEITIHNRIANELIRMKKAKSLETKNVALEMEISLTPELQKIFDETEEEIAEIAKVNANLIVERDELKKDIQNLTLKELRIKYPT